MASGIFTAGTSVGSAASGLQLGHLTTVSTSSPFASCHFAHGSPNIGLVGPGGIRLNAEAEAQIAAGPSGTLIGGWIQDNGLGLVAAASQNGGASWKVRPLPFTACAPGGLDYQEAADPWISIGPDGTAYAVGEVVKYVARTPGPDLTVSEGIVGAASSDNGCTWHNPGPVGINDESTAIRIADKPSVTADPTRPGVAYAVWAESAGYAAPTETWLAETVDGGRSWKTPRMISRVARSSDSANGNVIAIDPHSGRMYDLFDLYRTSPARKSCTGLGKRRRCVRIPASTATYVQSIVSTDRGVTWSAPLTVAKTVPGTLGPKLDPHMRLNSFPSVTTSPDAGRLYAVWMDGRFGRSHRDEIAIASSSDGRHWTKPALVSTGEASFLPSVVVNNAGVVGVTYYADQQDGKTRARVSSWFRSSMDGGKQFGKAIRLGGPFRLQAAPGYRIGDYEGLAAGGRTFHPLFVGTTADPQHPTGVLTRAVTP